MSDVKSNEQHVPGSREYRLESWQNALRVLQSMSPHEREKHFKMDRWGERTPCGTVACLAGHCQMDPWFQQSRGFGPTEFHAWGELQIAFSEFLATFGPVWERVFYLTALDHAGVVREVLRQIHRFGGEAISPFGFGMPTFKTALKEVP